ncbi:MAG TPA: amidohydrolase [Microscillaceae bacterium]|nr:amidohydrolase [Microscillaceae bacterium]
MKRTIVYIFIALLAVGLWSCGTTNQDSKDNTNTKETENTTAADLIVVNAKVATEKEGEFAKAFAVKDGKFIKVGTKTDVEKLRGEKTQIIDAKGKTVIPGLNDSHTHLIRAGLNYNMELRWDGVRSLKTALQMLKEQAARTPEGQWVRVVGGWGEHQFEEKRLPTLEEINAAVPDKPVYILYLYSLGYLNKKGVETLKYDKNTKFPGGEVQLGADDKPTGFLVAKPSALLLYKTLVKLPKLTRAQQLNSTLQYYRELNRLAVTSAIDAGGGGQYYPNNYSVAEELAKQGKLMVRTAYYLFAQEKGKEKDFYAEWTKKLEFGKNADMFKPNGYMMHGAGENLTWAAADFENFLEPRPELHDHMEDELIPIIEILAKNQWAFRIHATYNESIARFLDVFEKVDKKYPFLNKVRWIIDHAETINDANLKRIKKMGGGIAIQNRMFFQGEYFVDRYGAKAALRTPPMRKMIELGIPIGLGTDGTRVSSYNPWLSLYWAVSGKTWGGLQLYNKDNLLSRHEALKLMSNGSAWFSSEEKDKGFIKEGMYADFAILPEDYFTVAEDKIKDLTSVLTAVHGKIVFATGNFKEFDLAIDAPIPAWSPVIKYGGYQNQ